MSNQEGRHREGWASPSPQGSPPAEQKPSPAKPQEGRHRESWTNPSPPATQPAGPKPEPSKPRKRKGLVILVVCVLLAIGALLGFRGCSAASAKKKAAAAAAKGPPPVPVGVETVKQKDVPIYLDGLGTVQAFNTVTIRSRVDGQLDKVAFVEGQDVKIGDLLARIDPKPFETQVAQAEGKKAQDEAQLVNAKIQLKRDAELLFQKILAQQDYDTQKASADQFEAAVKSDQAAIDSAKVQLAYTTITSPLDGRTGVRQVDQGNIVHATDSNGLVVITQLRPISVAFTLPEQTLADIQKQMAQGELKVVAVDRDNSTVLDEGKLAVVDNEIDTTTGTIRLKASFPNANLKLWPGQFVNPRLLLTTRQGVVVPESVIQRGPEGSYAFLIQGEQTNLTVKVQPIKVGPIEAGDALIEEGLQAGQRVVVDGQYRLQSGSRVKVRAAGKAEDSNADQP
ncbi:MAG: rane fusion protein multidrug efflux system [Verrucomicrobiota bacterium]